MTGGPFNPQRAAIWQPEPMAGASGVTVIGMPALTTAGSTITARTPALTNEVTRSTRLGYVSGGGAGSIMTWRHPTPWVAKAASGIGGFRLLYRFAITDPAPVATARMFMGLRATGSAWTNVEPDSETNLFGIGHNSGDATWQVYSAGSAAQARTDTGMAIETGSAVYEVVLTSPGQESALFWAIRRLDGEGLGHAAGSLTSSSSSFRLQGGTLLSPINAFRSNGSTAAAVAVDLFFLQMETPL